MPDFDSKKFRTVLGHFPTGVTVITADKAANKAVDKAAGRAGGGTGDGKEDGEPKPAGFSVGSFASVSLDPPLVMFCAGKDSQSWPDIEAAGHFCVNVLSDAQAEVSNTFASKDIDKFEGVKWETRATGAPVLDGTLCWIDCEIQDVYEAGDHWIVIGLVKDLDVAEPEAEAAGGEAEGSEAAAQQGPLIFFKGGYFKAQSI